MSSRLDRRMRESFARPARIMEVCGTHTTSAARFGLSSLLPAGVDLVSGPGCPVCVTSQGDIDSFLALGAVPGVILASFGDMLRVPGSFTSLDRLRARGVDVRVVYSPLDALEIARHNATRQVVFFGVGFETTMPATALAIISAAEEDTTNFWVLCVHKTMPAALRALFAGETDICGLLLPGHVTTIIGADSFAFIPTEFGMPCAVAGFEPLDMLLGVESILNQIRQGEAYVDNVYTRAAGDRPNERAAALLQNVFTPCDGDWRGLGPIPLSAVRISREYARFDARLQFAEVLSASAPVKRSPCRCGDVLRGRIPASQCPFFGKECTPTQPLGPCMVSTEGACAASYQFGDVN